jgi:DNA-binding MurR/RpiR family transcriptional regulator
MQELAQAALRRDTTLIVLTNSQDNSLARLTEHVLVVRAPSAREGGTVLVCFHVALNLLAVLAAGVLKRPGPHQEALEREFANLPDQLDRLAIQQVPAVRSLAGEVTGFERVSVLGGGFYHFPALHLSRALCGLAGLAADGMEVADFRAELSCKRHALVLLSSSRSKIKKLAHRAAAEARVRGASVFAITDGNDRELVERATMALLVPALAEVTGSTVSLFLGEWLALEAGKSRGQGPGIRD